MGSTERNSAVVLLSAGLDSSFNLFKAHERFKVVMTLTFDYGQQAAQQEIKRARALASSLQLPHTVVPVPWFRDFTRTALVSGQGLPTGEQVEIDSMDRSLATAKSVWVPNRNGILLNIGAAYAEGLGAQYVIPGFNAEEAKTFPDNSAEFLRTLDESWAFSTATGVRTLCFSTLMQKTEIVAEGVKIGLPFHQLWPCYQASETWCGVCESCLRFERALADNGLSFEQLREAQL